MAALVPTLRRTRTTRMGLLLPGPSARVGPERLLKPRPRRSGAEPPSAIAGATITPLRTHVAAALPRGTIMKAFTHARVRTRHGVDGED
jgi:hypothetical protein